MINFKTLIERIVQMVLEEVLDDDTPLVDLKHAQETILLRCTEEVQDELQATFKNITADQAKGIVLTMIPLFSEVVHDKIKMTFVFK